MCMNLVGIDISIDSTAVSILRKNIDEQDDLIICNFTTLKKNTGWIVKTMAYIDYEFINYSYKNIDNNNYTEKEIIKLREYDHITDLIYNKIIGNIDKSKKTLISIEGFNYGLKGNSIIDIVAFSTLLKIKLLNVVNLVKIIIFSPMTVKSEAASLSYGYTLNKKGKKIINKNPNDVSGGRFDKKQMLEAYLNLNEQDGLSKILNKYKDELLKLKNVPKPWDDIIDANFLMRILKNSDSFLL